MTSADARVTVVIPTYNRAVEAERTVRHLLSVPEQPAIVVVDNGSSDGTSQRLAREFSGVKIIPLKANLGAAARNIGMQTAETPYVALCDDDTWWAPGSLGRAADLFAAYPRLAVITGRVLIGSENREDPICQAMATSPLSYPSQLPGPSLLGFLAGASMVRRSAFLAVGGFEPRFFLGGEEAMVAADLAAAGWALAYVNEVVIHHHPSPHRNTRARQWLLYRNALWFAWLRRPFPTAWRQTLDSLRSVQRHPRLLRGLLLALLGLPWVLQHRRVLPAQVEGALRQLEQQN